MGEPPFDKGVVQETDAEALAPVAVGASGAEGTGAGVTALDGPEAGPVPAALVAVTLKV
jgi:hypothetical protein